MRLPTVVEQHAALTGKGMKGEGAGSGSEPPPNRTKYAPKPDAQQFRKGNLSSLAIDLPREERLYLYVLSKLYIALGWDLKWSCKEHC